ncbi:diguanylate cyclase/phosphodiesterase [Motilibacter rhizosphaerae]|uniref:Diguanylate cyclase/phosphodiesterase n=1 Tax=Motilibacter rhizosphaerae TaxID=598652 RepID=A0A4Q7NW23_9ACTN|nr:EAL domain-containing protein [Motilibacter rhizosphaerae]RZS91364.1 diguanylate cyclase/phosphodiesterase [Motilibacter rhizosphaerae]
MESWRAALPRYGPHALTGLLSIAAVALIALAVDVVPGSGRPWDLLWLTVAFLLADMLVLKLEVRRQTLVVHFAEIPLVVGLLVSGPVWLVLARTLGVGIGGVLGKLPPYKWFFNVALYLVATTLAVLSFHVLADDTHTSHHGAAAAAAAAVSTAAAALFEFVVVQVVIALVQARPPSRQIMLALWTLVLSGAVSVLTGLVVVTLLQGQVWQRWLLVPLAVVIYLAYRAYSRLLGRHLALERLYEMARSARSSTDRQQALEALLQRVRDVLNAEEARIVVPPDEHSPYGWSARSWEDGFEVPAGGDGVLHELVRSSGAPRLVSSGTNDPALQRWLRERGAREAIVVALSGEAGIIGTLEVTDHLAEVRPFGPADVELLETLAAHAGFALENSNLLERLQYDATHDPLTGLGNRVAFVDALTAALDGKQPAAVCMLDLDEFKDINDALGHHSGDRLLHLVAERLSAALPEAALVARFGGDEFGVLLHTAEQSVAEQVARRIVEALAEPVPLAEAVIHVGASIGVALAPEHAHDAAVLLQRAEIAMYAAKEAGRDLRVFDSTLDDGTPRRLALVAELRDALRQSELVVYYQPKVRLDDEEIAGVEALVRWHHPTRGIVGPDDFIPLAERSGLIEPLTGVVLESSLRQCRAWLDEGKHVPVAVNISVRALLDPGFVEQVARVLERTGVAPAMLTLELTESSVMSDLPRCMGTLHQLVASGVRISVDDFGTGWSSLSQLRHLPASEVKIDKSFILAMATDEHDIAVVGAIVKLAHDLGKRVVAEGIEDKLTWRKLADLGCDVAQGFFLSRPLPPERLAAWMRENALSPGHPVDAPDAAVRRKAYPLRLVSRG